MKRLVLLCVVMLLSVCCSVTVNAQSSAPVREKGLLITPLRQFLATDAGKSARSTFSLANLTDSPLRVTLSVKQFSVTDYVYTYQFNQPSEDWIHISVTSLTLQPNQTQTIPYDVNVPAGSAPGGHYYTLFASADLASSGVSSTIQATDLLYLTVNGNLTHSSKLQHSSIHRIAFGRNIPFNLQPVNTGNIYFFVYVSGELHGLFSRPASTPSTHILMPGKVRTLGGDIPSPVLPGIYRAVFGYKTDTGATIMQARYIVYIPPWFIAVVIAALLLITKFYVRTHPAHVRTQETSDMDDKL
jgi:hypothetical protein